MSLRLDHVGFVVPDLAAARKALGRVGFSTTALGRHPSFGTANHLLMFERDYCEILGIESHGPQNEQIAGRIADRPGLAVLALATDDIDADVQRARQRGVEMEDPFEFGRPVVIDGRPVEARFRIARAAQFYGPDLFLFLCEHRTPHYVWRDEWLRHRNGATGLAGATFVAAEPLTAASRYAALFDAAPAANSAHECELRVGPHTLRFVTSGRLKDLFPLASFPPLTIAGDVYPAMLAFRMPDIDAFARTLAAAGLEWHSFVPGPGMYMSVPELGHTLIGFV